jgi:hypothetical protein
MRAQVYLVLTVSIFLGIENGALPKGGNSLIVLTCAR